MAKSATIEESFEKLDKIVSQLEDGSLSMNEAFKLYKEGVQLVNNCNNMLDKVEKQLVVLNGSEETDDDLIHPYCHRVIPRLFVATQETQYWQGEYGCRQRG